MKLFEFELAWAAAAFEAVFPERTSLPHGIARMNPGRFLADTIAACPLEQSIGLRLTLWIVALAPLYFLRRPKTIASIQLNERQRVLELLLASPVYAVRQLVVAFKAMGSMLYAQSPAARDAMTTPRATLWESGLVQVGRKKNSSKSMPAASAPAVPAAAAPLAGEQSNVA
jgi:hypothetical protein